jgi:thioredoxin reductase
MRRIDCLVIGAGSAGLYAAGDGVGALNRIGVATGRAAIAATDMHNRLLHHRSEP